MKLKLEVPVEGYEPTVEWRIPRKGEEYVSDGCGRLIKTCTIQLDTKRLVLTPNAEKLKSIYESHGLTW